MPAQAAARVRRSNGSAKARVRSATRITRPAEPGLSGSTRLPITWRVMSAIVCVPTASRRPLRRIHALHHQARQPTYIDALFVHPVETVIGLILFLGSIPLIAALSGGPLNAFSMAVATLVFTQANQINHTWVNLPHFPFKTLDHITSIHAAHHVNMNCGNFATLTMLYDWLFGTLEQPVSRPAP